MRAMYTAATGMDAQMVRIDTVANNLANANTSGFKKSRVDFADLMYVALREPDGGQTQTTDTPTGLEVGTGVSAVSTLKVFTQGAVSKTDGELDMAIMGQGFFQVEVPNGDIRYTRDGNFRTGPDGGIVNSRGYPLYPRLSLPTDVTAISIGTDGTLSILDGAGQQSTVGTVQLARFANPAGLASKGGNMFGETVASGTPTTGTAGAGGFGELLQGYVETSNVSVVKELVDLIMAQRTYELNSKVVKAGDRILQATNYLVS